MALDTNLLRSIQDHLEKLVNLTSKSTPAIEKLAASSGQLRGIPSQGPPPAAPSFDWGDLPAPRSVAQTDEESKPKTRTGQQILANQQKLQGMLGGGKPGTAAGIGGAVVTGAAKIGEGMQDPNETTGLGKVAGGMGTIAGGVIGGAIAGPGGAVAGGVVGVFAEKLMEATDKLQKWTHSLHDINMQFAEFSPAMAGVKARQEVRDIQLSGERGDRRAESAEKLAEAMNKLDRELAPIQDWFGDARNNIAAGMSDKVADLISAVKSTYKWKKSEDEEKKEAAEREAREGATAESVLNFEKFQEETAKNWARAQRPQRFRP